LGMCWRTLEWKRFYGHLEYISDTWYTLWSFGNFGVMKYIFPRFGILCQEKSGNPDRHQIKVIKQDPWPLNQQYF
jgi:hypothetical protein